MMHPHRASDSSVSFRLSGLACCAWTASPTAATSTESIKIGAVLPFSGGVELYGRQAKLGLDLAAKEINAGGGHPRPAGGAPLRGRQDRSRRSQWMRRAS
jgi:ABC-type branched-subunit amino acid transport system substrate-binding protein